MNTAKALALIAFISLQRILTAFFFTFTLLFTYFELTLGRGWVSAGCFVIASGLFWCAGTGLHGAWLGGQRLSGLFFAVIFCGIAYALMGTLQGSSPTAVLSMMPLSWGISGFVVAWFATSKRHIAEATHVPSEIS